MYKHVSRTVHVNYNFTHAWHSTHGNTQFFACQMPRFSVELVIYTRREKPFTRYEMRDRHESCRHGHVSRTRRTGTWLAKIYAYDAVFMQVSVSGDVCGYGGAQPH